MFHSNHKRTGQEQLVVASHQLHSKKYHSQSTPPTVTVSRIHTLLSDCLGFGHTGRADGPLNLAVMIENNCSSQDETTVLDSLRVVWHEDVNLGNHDGLFNNAIYLSFTNKQTETDASWILAGVCDVGGLLTANFDSMCQRGFNVTTLLPKEPPGLCVTDILLDVGDLLIMAGELPWRNAAKKCFTSQLFT